MALEPGHPLYRDRAANLSREELSELASLRAALPREIVDVHTHSNLVEHVAVLPHWVRGLPLSTFPHYSLNQAKEFRSLLWPGKSVSSFRFANAYAGIDHRSANAYLSRAVVGTRDYFVPYGLADDIEYTFGLIAAHPVALKMYARYFDPPAREICEFFPRPVLERCQALGVPIILHLPRSLVESGNELMEILEAMPDLRVVLAHCGLVRTGVVAEIDVLHRLSRYPNVVVDTALVVQPDIITVAMEAFGLGRVLYGSDEPLSLISAVEYEHPSKGKQWASSTPYHWLDSNDAARYGNRNSERLLHTAQLTAIRSAVGSLRVPGDRAHAFRSIFGGNAVKYFGLKAANQ